MRGQIIRPPPIDIAEIHVARPEESAASDINKNYRIVFHMLFFASENFIIGDLARKFIFRYEI